MRVGEATRLACGDVDLSTGLVTIRHAKFDRDRLVPLDASVSAALRGYATGRDRLCPTPRADTFFLSSIGRSLQRAQVNAAFRTICAWAGIASTDAGSPRIHDLRHSFAVNTLIGWQRDGVDIASRLPVLSTYLGHVNPASTFWYLSAVPQLMQLAAARLDSGSTRSRGAGS